MDEKLDSKSLELISLLRVNARSSIVDLARKLKVSRATVQNKINRLERDGIILGYTVKLKPTAETHPVRMLMNISVEARKEAAVIRRLRGFPEVIAVHHTTGHWDIIAEIHATTLPSLNAILSEIRLIDGIVNTETNLLTDSYL